MYTGDYNFLKREFNKFINRESQLSSEYYVLYSSWTPQIKFYYDILLIIKSILNNTHFSNKFKKIRDHAGLSDINKLFDILQKKYPVGFASGYKNGKPSNAQNIKHSAIGIFSAGADTKKNIINDTSGICKIRNYDMPRSIAIKEDNTKCILESDPQEWCDHKLMFKNYAISTNLSLFANLCYDTESTFLFFLEKKNYQPPTFINTFLIDLLGLDINSDDYNNLINIFNKYFEKYHFGIMNQIFIHKSIVDDIIYLSGSDGFPLNINNTLNYKPSQILNLYQKGNLTEINEILYDLIKLHSNKSSNNYDKRFYYSLKYQIGNEKYLADSLEARLIYNEKYFLDGKNVLIFENDIPGFVSNLYYDELTNYLTYLVYKSLYEQKFNFDSTFIKTSINLPNSNIFPLQKAGNFEKTKNSLKNMFMYYFPLPFKTSYLNKNKTVTDQHSELFTINTNEIINKSIQYVNPNLSERNKIFIGRELNKMIIRERQLANDYFVVYTANTTSVKFYYDVLTIIYNTINYDNFNLYKKKIRLTSEHNSLDDFFDIIYKKIYMADNNITDINQVPKDPLLYENIYNDSAFDHSTFFKEKAISCNLSLFGNMGNSGECTLLFYLQNINVSDTTWLFGECKKRLTELLGKANLKKYKLIFEKYFMEKQTGILNQIFIKKEIVDNVLYISTAYGLPLNNNKYYDNASIGSTRAFLELYRNGQIDELIDIIVKQNDSSSIKNIKNFLSLQDKWDILKKPDYNLLNNLQGRLVYDMDIFDNNQVLFFETEYNDVNYEQYYNELITTILNDLTRSIDENIINTETFKKSPLYIISNKK